MIVLGIDPGLATLGWGVIEAERGSLPDSFLRGEDRPCQQ